MSLLRNIDPGPVDYLLLGGKNATDIQTDMHWSTRYSSLTLQREENVFRPKLFLSMHFPIYYSLIILSFEAIQSEILRA
jgi:hypothetical protein